MPPVPASTPENVLPPPMPVDSVKPESPTVPDPPSEPSVSLPPSASVAPVATVLIGAALKRSAAPSVSVPPVTSTVPAALRLLMRLAPALVSAPVPRSRLARPSFSA